MQRRPLRRRLDPAHRRPDIQNLPAAAKLDWSRIDPAILATKFERGLDHSRRVQLGARCIARDNIKIIQPVVIDPLPAGWAETGPLDV